MNSDNHKHYGTLVIFLYFMIKINMINNSDDDDDDNNNNINNNNNMLVASKHIHFF